MSSKGWIGVDLDGTLAEYHGWKGASHIGAPVPRMMERVKSWLAEGLEVRIFTARVYHDNSSVRVYEAYVARDAIVAWCKEHIGQELPITNVKDYAMVTLWDDRAVQVIPNTGERADSGEPFKGLLQEARKDWVRDTEWQGDQYGGCEVQTGAALRAFGEKIDKAFE